jgi:FkbM family methyltransferase
MDSIALDLPVTPPILMRLHNDDELISRVLRRQRLWEAASSWFCLRHVQPGDHVVDIGANIGYYSLLLSRRVGPQGRVDAFEPEPLNLALLGANLQINDCSNVVVHPLALADTHGQRPLYICPSNRGDHRLGFTPDRDVITVPVTTADRCLGARLARMDFVKIDVQGAEELVLRGMRELIEQNRRRLTMLIELSPSLLTNVGSTYGSLLALIEEMGGRYLLFDRWSPGAVSLREIEPAEVRALAGGMLHSGVDDAFVNLVLVFNAEAMRQVHQRAELTQSEERRIASDRCDKIAGPRAALRR